MQTVRFSFRRPTRPRRQHGSALRREAGERGPDGWIGPARRSAVSKNVSVGPTRPSVKSKHALDGTPRLPARWNGRGSSRHALRRSSKTLPPGPGRPGAGEHNGQEGFARSLTAAKGVPDGQKEQWGSPTIVLDGQKEQWGFPTIVLDG